MSHRGTMNCLTGVPCTDLGGVRKYLGGELNSPVVDWLNKGLMTVSSPTDLGGVLRQPPNLGSRPPSFNQQSLPRKRNTTRPLPRYAMYGRSLL
eukprot:8183318-Pyramimonas_sp.AAC.1